ncbi:MAG: hypothetical protein IBJ18_01480 [Phycisphaerales bacterium]|nr:hypothetical protein [Phycisphaerales bacterium]
MRDPLATFCASFIACVTSCLGLATSSHAQVFSNTGAITCPPGTNYPSLYPSVINVPLNGVSGNVVRRVAVTIKGFNHTWLADAQILLVPPVGAPIQLLANNTGAGDANNATVTFFAEAPAAIPEPGSNLPSGAYVPNPNGISTFIAPAPAGPYTGTLAALSGVASNGFWSLYVADSFSAADPLSITGGWELEFFDDPTPTPTAFTYQGKLNPGVTGPINARFSVWQSASNSNSAMRLLGPLSVSAIPVNQGVFTANVDFGKSLPGDRALWLEVEIESPAGSGFVKLTPRQPLTVPPVVSGGWSSQLQTVGGAASVSTPSRVGIGVLKPSMSLQVASPSSLSNLPTIGLTNGTNFLYASLQGAGSPGSIIWSNGNALRFGVESSLGSSYSELMRIDEVGNVAIGNTTPQARLDVRGNIRFGNTSQYSAVGAGETLRITRGSVSALGTVTGGSGFTVSRTGVGLYRIQWTGPNGFSDFPTFTGNAISSNVIVTTTSGALNPDGSGLVDVRCANGGGAQIDSAFSFTLIGGR